MKNLILLVIAILLGVFTYFFQELQDREDYKNEQRKGQILNPEELGEIKGFSLPQVDLIKQGDQFLFPESGELVDERRVEWFMKILAGVKIKRVIPKEQWQNKKREDFFDDEEKKIEFIFHGQSVSFLLGKKLDFDRSFYMEVTTQEKTELVIAFDSGDHEAIYDKSQAHRSDHHYQRILSLINLDKNFFKDHRIFRHWMNKKWSLLELDFTDGRNRDYTINFPEAKTNPAVPNLLSLKKQAVLDLEKKIVSLEAVSFYKGKNSLPPLVKVTVNSTQGEARLEVYPSADPKLKDHHLLKSSLDGHTYVVKSADILILLAPVQNYWDLRLLKERPSQLGVQFEERGDLISFKSEDGRFYAEGKKLKPIHESFKGLLDFLRQPASYWSAGSEIRESAVKQFELDWGQGVFFLMIRSGEIVLYHKESTQALIYKIEGSPPIKVMGVDYFYE
ncbi:MAG: hypothetical protein VXV96_13190 [Bdellovibrionota bacterium]|nr:hypothetical protein [Bdellovibrionota bacterium]